MKPNLIPLIATCLWASQAPATELSLPTTARLAASVDEGMGSVVLPVAGWKEGDVEALRAEGGIERQAWQIQASNLTTLQILAPLREQLLGEGFELVYECDARECGGFDFRYAIDVFSEPDMHVDLGDYRYALFRRAGGAEPDLMCLLVSRTTERGFVQVTRVTPRAQGGNTALAANAALDVGRASTAGDPNAGFGQVATNLETRGRAVLGDLSFQTGSSKLAADPFTSLDQLSAFLAANPERRIVLVGHTDAEGSLAANVALSRKRALAVMRRLQERYGVATARMDAEGVGFLAPLASNATETGRTLNRRVEVILSDPG